ncbi:unnamed protein product [Alternaria alternata]
MGGAVHDIEMPSKVATVKDVNLSQIYSESVLAKVVQVAQRGLKQEVRHNPSNSTGAPISSATSYELRHLYNHIPTPYLK